MIITVFGATGVLGAHVVPRLLECGHTVRAVVRPGGRALALAHPQLATVTGSLLDASSCDAALEGSEAALHLATAIPAPGPAMDWTPNDAVRREGTRNLIDAGLRHGVRRYVLQSVGMLASDAGGRLLDESEPVTTSPVIQSAHDLETMALAAPINATILRGGSFYGPGTGRSPAWTQQAREGKLQYWGDGSLYMSLIHVVDMARAVVSATVQDNPAASGVFNIVDDTPVTERVLFDHLAQRFGTAAATTGGRPIFPSFRLSNQKARDVLGWAPAYPSYLSGWQG